MKPYLAPVKKSICSCNLPDDTNMLLAHNWVVKANFTFFTQNKVALNINFEIA